MRNDEHGCEGNFLLRPLLITAGFTALLMTAFEVVKTLALPDITLWDSHILTIIFTTMLAVLAAFFVGYRLKLLNTRLHTSNAALNTNNQNLVAEILQRQDAESRVHYMAHHDALTELPNRILLADRISQAIVHAQRKRQLVAVLFIDLDEFKRVNDLLGHQIGDQLLRQVAARLRGCVREGDTVARLGGDEFVLSVGGLADSKGASPLAEKALLALGTCFTIDGHDLHINASIGISIYPFDGDNADALLRAADTAMYHAKERGRGNYQYFTQKLNEAARQRHIMANMLHQAHEQQEFELYYQPQVDLQDNRVCAAEALIRWPQPGAGYIAASDFIPVAEDIGLILPIGAWVLREACLQMQQWHNAGHTDLRVAVNLSPRQFFQADFSEIVRATLAEANLSPSALELEITESVLLQSSLENLTTLRAISELGVRLSVDDFGIGYSSLTYLKAFPIDALKIDRSFVNGVNRNPNDGPIVKAIIALAQSLDLKVVAEGVESAEQAAFLKMCGCRTVQGYYYSHPLSAKGFGEMLKGELALAHGV